MSRLDTSPEALERAWAVVLENEGLVHFALNRYQKRYRGPTSGDGENPQRYFGDDEVESALRAQAEETLLRAAQTWDPARSTLAHYYLSIVTWDLHDAMRRLLSQKGGAKGHRHGRDEVNRPLPSEDNIEDLVRRANQRHGRDDLEPEAAIPDLPREPDFVDDALDRLLIDELEAEVRHLVAWLPEFQRKCVELVSSGMTYSAAGRVLGKTDVTVSKHYHRAIETIREVLATDERRELWQEIG